MWSGAIPCVQPRRLADAVDGHHVRADPVDRGRPSPSASAPGPGRGARRRRCGSRSGPRVSAAAISAFSVAITDGSSIRKSHGRRPSGASSSMCPRSSSTAAPRARKASRCGSSRRRPITSPPGGGICGAPEPGQQRAGEQERGTDPLGQLLVDLAAVDARAVDRDLARAEPLRPARRAARAAASSPPRPGSAGTLRRITSSSVSRHAARIGQRAVLVAGGHDRARQGHPAFDYELLHGWPESSLSGGRVRSPVVAARLGAHRPATLCA